MSRILWIDDAYGAIQGLMRPLELSGHEIVPARDIASALNKLQGGASFQLVIVDILLPLYESADDAVPEGVRARLEAGCRPGEALIAYIRGELGFRIPIVVLSVLAHDGLVRDRLEPCEISAFLEKVATSPRQLSEKVEQVLGDYDFERAVVFDLRSDRREEREVGLDYVATMKTKPSPRIYQALVELLAKETVPALRAKATSILQEYPRRWEEVTGPGAGKGEAETAETPGRIRKLAPDTGVAKHAPKPERSSPASGVAQDSEGSGTRTPGQHAVDVMLLLAGVAGMAVVMIILGLAMKSFTAVLIIPAVVVAALLVLVAMGILTPEQLTESLRDVWRLLEHIVPRGTHRDDDSHDEEKGTPSEPVQD